MLAGLCPLCISLILREPQRTLRLCAIFFLPSAVPPVAARLPFD